ncbi:cutinase transcription factor 1 beta [Fusarium circinatum]|uniref:Cutinase transcription factor 1 beta n=1 Tax=Fusarium circinatum TaxID=48490 RepID=A0A8H5UPD2_FUSCI|nr:cutinase transcription factor 1 beta [Fusarium circinatum]
MFFVNLFQSPLMFKRNAFQRAKTLYDADYEKNKVTLIQSIFLMGHFYADAEDRLDPWHWNGIAISLSHTIGLQMLTSPSRNGIRPLWRRIWWCIYYREEQGLPEPPSKKTRMKFEPTGSTTRAMARMQTGAAHATHAINCMMAEGLIKFAQTIAVLTISPPIQVHLLEMASSKSPSGKLAKHNLALCLLALYEMRKYYVSADAAYKLFDRARIMVEKSLRNDEIDSRGSAPAADCPQEPQGVETSEWLDESASMSYDVTSVGLFSALWIPFANLIPDESLDGSF